MMMTEEYWDSMCPEERVCQGELEYLADKRLEANWKDLEETVQNHLIILLSGKKGSK